MKKLMLVLLAVAVVGGFYMSAGEVLGADRKAPPRMLRHVVLLKFKDDTAPERVKEIERAFLGLKKEIDAFFNIIFLLKLGWCPFFN